VKRPADNRKKATTPPGGDKKKYGPGNGAQAKGRDPYAGLNQKNRKIALKTPPREPEPKTPPERELVLIP